MNSKNDFWDINRLMSDVGCEGQPFQSPVHSLSTQRSPQYIMINDKNTKEKTPKQEYGEIEKFDQNKEKSDNLHNKYPKIISMTIEISDDVEEVIDIHKGDKPEDIADKIVKKYNIQGDIVNCLIKLIDEKIQEALNQRTQPQNGIVENCENQQINLPNSSETCSKRSLKKSEIEKIDHRKIVENNESNKSIIKRGGLNINVDEYGVKEGEENINEESDLIQNQPNSENILERNKGKSDLETLNKTITKTNFFNDYVKKMNSTNSLKQLKKFHKEVKSRYLQNINMKKGETKEIRI